MLFTSQEKFDVQDLDVHFVNLVSLDNQVQESNIMLCFTQKHSKRCFMKDDLPGHLVTKTLNSKRFRLSQDIIWRNGSATW